MRVEATIVQQVSDYINFNMKEWVDATIGEQIRNSAREVGLGDHVVDSIRTIKYADEVKIVCDYKVDNFPVGVVLNNGRKEVNAKMVDGKLKLLHFFLKDGTEIFTKHSKAFAGYKFMERGMILGYPILQDILAEATQQEVDNR